MLYRCFHAHMCFFSVLFAFGCKPSASSVAELQKGTGVYSDNSDLNTSFKVDPMPQ